MNDYLSKPVMPADLARILERWLLAETTPPSSEITPRSTNMPRTSAPKENSSPTAAYFDPVDLLDRMGEDLNLAVEVVQVSLDDLPRQLEALEQAAVTGDLSELAAVAHGIKGAAANVAAETLAREASLLERTAHSGTLTSVRDLTVATLHTGRLTLDRMRAWCLQVSPSPATDPS